MKNILDFFKDFTKIYVYIYLSHKNPFCIKFSLDCKSTMTDIILQIWILSEFSYEFLYWLLAI